ncbi:hypothetical protein P4S68_04030 [Pseudoalteromonas sp. Hal099]
MQNTTATCKQAHSRKLDERKMLPKEIEEAKEKADKIYEKYSQARTPVKVAYFNLRLAKPKCLTRANASRISPFLYQFT